MKITRTLSAAVLAGGLLLAGTACSPETPKISPVPSASNTQTATPTADSTVAPSPSASATASASSPVAVPAETVTAPAPVAEVPRLSEAGKAAASVSSYYLFVGSEGTLDRLKATGGITNTPTDAEAQALVAKFPDGFKYFDTSSKENVVNAYNQMFARATQAERTPGAEVNIPAESIKVDGNKAVLDSSQAAVLIGDDVKMLSEKPYFELAKIELVKKDSGEWVVIPEPARQAIP